MKKRICSALLASAMVLALAACSSGGAAATTAAPAAPAATTAAATTAAPATQAPTKAPESVAETSKYPEKDITAVYFSKVGSGGDVMLRTMAKALEGKLNGHNMVVENRVGSSGGVAMAYLKECAPDGYTIMGTSTSIVLSSVFTDIPVPYTEFKFVCGMVKDPEYIYCRADLPFDDIQGLIAYAKEHPGELSFGFPMPQSSEALSQTCLIQESGIDANVVVFEGGPECFTSLLGGHIDVSAGSYDDFGASYENGDIKVLATLLGAPTSTLPDVKPLCEQGIDVTLEKARGIIVPKDTPDEVCAEIDRLVRMAMDSEEFHTVIEGQGCEVVYIPGDELRDMYDKFAEYAKSKLG